MPQADLRPTAHRVAELVAATADEQLDEPTPCGDWTVGDLVEHIGALSLAFTAAASKTRNQYSEMVPTGDAARLDVDWRERIPRNLEGLGRAWLDPAAWTGMTRVARGDAPAEATGLVALSEIVVHGWDLARGIGQPYDCDDATVEAIRATVAQLSEASQAPGAVGPYGPPVAGADDATPLDQVLTLAGRDPAWSPPPRHP